MFLKLNCLQNINMLGTLVDFMNIFYTRFLHQGLTEKFENSDKMQ